MATLRWPISECDACGPALDSVRLSPHHRLLNAPRMPRNPKYPLEPLHEHRDRTALAATKQLGEAVRIRESAEEAKRRAEEERREAEAHAAEVRRDEAELLARGDLRVADLARAEAWEHAASTAMSALGRAIARADETVSAAQAAVGQARADLAVKKADLDVVTKDKARFTDRVRRDGDAAEEEAAEEVFTARRESGGKS